MLTQEFDNNEAKTSAIMIGFKNNQNYGFIAVMPKSYKEDNLVDDYNAAYEAGIPIILVDNMKEMKFGLEQVKEKYNSSYVGIFNLSHGNKGFAYIGSEKVNKNTNLYAENRFDFKKNISNY